MHYRMEFAERVRRAREKVGMSQPEMAAALTSAGGRLVSSDTYRKYESTSGKQNTLLPHDLILPFCDITSTHPFELLAPVPVQQIAHTQIKRRKAA